MDHPANSPAAQLPPKPKGGCGCCAFGCFSMFLIGLAGLLVGIFGSWFVYTKGVDMFTADRSQSVAVAAPSEAEYAAANDKLTQIRGARATEESATVEFSAADINALIARHPDFADLRGKARVSIANSLLTADVSVPLSAIDVPRVRDRWFNGTVTFGLAYNEDSFDFALRSLNANGHDLDLSALQSVADRLNRALNTSFDKSEQERDRSRRFSETVKSLAVVGDKVVVTTKGQAVETSAP